MRYRRLFLFLEGLDDQRFFERVVVPQLRGRYEEIRLVLISEEKKEDVAEWLRSVEGMKADYIFVRDLDRFPCVTAAKETLREGHPRLDPARIQIVKAEIESWYCAGIRQEAMAKALKCADTEEITKERFATVFPGDRIAALISILEQFDLQAAARRNASLRYFLRKYLEMEM